MSSLRRIVTGGLATTLLVSGLFISVGVDPGGASDGWSNVIESTDEIRDMAYPLGNDAGSYVDTWLYSRGSRRHLGVDMMAPKLVHILAANDGCITYLDYGGTGGGNMLTLTDNDGWQYRYIHINNDSPGTDDGANPYEWAFVDNLQEGDCISRGDHISYVGDSGNAEWTGSHLHFELRRPDGNWINPFPSTEAARAAALNSPQPPSVPAAPDETSPDETSPDETSPDETSPDEASPDGTVPDGTGPDALPDNEAEVDPPPLEPQCTAVRTAPAGTPDIDTATGYWMLDDSGVVHAEGVPHYGDLSEIEDAGAPVSMASTSTSEGYWIVDADGVVHPFGDAEAHGDMSGVDLNGPVRRIEPTSDGHGYWLVGNDGGVFTFGSAGFLGSTGNLRLRQPVISMTATAADDGYWLIARDGGVFTFGEAEFYGSTGSMRLDAPVIDMAVSPSGLGYWLYAADGGVFSFGVGFHGSVPGLGLCDYGSSVAMRVTPTGGGYWIATDQGEVFSFGDAAEFDALVMLPDQVTVLDLAIAHHPLVSELSTGGSDSV